MNPGITEILATRLISQFRLQDAAIGGQPVILSSVNSGGGGFFD